MTNHDYTVTRQYNKLVRDLIPEHIASLGKPYKTHIADETEYRQKLYQKLKEEVAEYCANPETDDLADIVEVVYALAALHGLDRAKVEAVRAAKAQVRGGFSRRIILEES
jgi:predicted house-cleaning noncanonical NTP pyrophosphatase (MazG superfamily)